MSRKRIRAHANPLSDVDVDWSVEGRGKRQLKAEAVAAGTAEELAVFSSALDAALMRKEIVREKEER